MTVIQWTEKLRLNLEAIDALHIEFIDMLNEFAGAPDDALVERFDALAAHCELHFADEEGWMKRTGFPPIGCHQREHEQVLEVLREVRKRLVNEGDIDLARRLGAELPEWFEHHATTMDHALAEFLRLRGSDDLFSAEPPA